LIGASTGDMLGTNYPSFEGDFRAAFNGDVTALTNGSYVVTSPAVSNNGVFRAGAVSSARPVMGWFGPVSSANSVLGSVEYGGKDMVSAYDATRDRLIVGVPANNKVSIINGDNFAAPALNVDQHGITGSWYNPATGGQGIEMEMYPDLAGPGKGVLFAGWFTFDVTAAGGQRWYALQGSTNGRRRSRSTSPPATPATLPRRRP
jgi:hypothetical protein